MNEIITVNEIRNEGKDIHLYFNGLVGLYTAYGYSAFILSKKTSVHPAYSQSMQMPVVVINAAHLEEVIRILNVVKQEKGYCHLTVEDSFDEKEYINWASKLRRGED